MQVLTQGGYSGEKTGTSLALGYFDGVHIGHAAVITAAREYAQKNNLDLGIFTFTLNNGNNGGNGKNIKGRRLASTEQKNRAFTDLGVAYCFEPPFSAFHHLTPEQFFHTKLLGEYKAKALFCGQNYGFGAKRAGDVALLRKLCEENGIYLSIVPTAIWQGEPVSSSRIREALTQGDIPDVNTMLGRPYEIDFPVRHGRGLGSVLGFPTINQVFPPEMHPPKQGVYITGAILDGEMFPSATGFGNRPSVGGQDVTCETFIPHFEGDLYNKKVRVQFFKHIADTHKFESKQALAAAVHQWAGQAIEYVTAISKNIDILNF